MKFIRLLAPLLLPAVLHAETIQIIAPDQHGQPRVVARTTTATTQLPDGSAQTTSTTTHSDSSGKLILAGTSTSVAKPAENGVTTTIRTESLPDFRGALRPDRQITERVTRVNETETRTERTIQELNQTLGTARVSARETAVARTQDNTTTTETMIQKPTANGWRDEGRVRTVETKAADGSIQREIIESSRSQADRQTSSSGLGDSLQPRHKIVERETKQADGTKVIERQTYRRNVNGDWQPVTFTSEAGNPRR